VRSFSIRTLFSGKDDSKNAFLSIQAGAGGTDAFDWAEMLLRMYTRWCEQAGFDLTLVEKNPHEEAGIKSATLNVKGRYAYGHLKSEMGTHRLVRISPFDSGNRRHTSFASVDVVPQIDEAIQVEISDSDLRIDTYRSSGAGGQHVNVTDSAVRITHLPTKIAVQCQNERSQHANRRVAMAMLQAKLYQIEQQKRDDEVARAYGEKGDIAFGNQIRSYWLQPEQRVKDKRTGVETGNVEGVLDGDLDPFIEAYLKSLVARSRR
ncbi:MAG: peptide chain release factor 2, partial [Planctomycetota bacterium]|nr:peptide chain release factor 2 [Planctomycetota bacterium]